MGYYYIQVDNEKSNKIVVKSDLSGAINRENTYRISREDYEKDILGKVYDVENKIIVEGE